MPALLFAFSAAEFLDEELEENWRDGWYQYNPDSKHPHEWWGLWSDQL